MSKCGVEIFSKKKITLSPNDVWDESNAIKSPNVFFFLIYIPRTVKPELNAVCPSVRCVQPSLAAVQLYLFCTS